MVENLSTLVIFGLIRIFKTQHQKQSKFDPLREGSHSQNTVKVDISLISEKRKYRGKKQVKNGQNRENKI